MCVDWWEGYLMKLLIHLRQCWDFTSELAAVTQNLRAWEHLSACIALLATWLVVGILPAWLRFLFIWRVDVELDRCDSWVSHFRRLLCKVVSPHFLSHSELFGFLFLIALFDLQLAVYQFILLSALVNRPNARCHSNHCQDWENRNQNDLQLNLCKISLRLDRIPCLSLLNRYKLTDIKVSVAIHRLTLIELQFEICFRHNHQVEHILHRGYLRLLKLQHSLVCALYHNLALAFQNTQWACHICEHAYLFWEELLWLQLCAALIDARTTQMLGKNVCWHLVVRTVEEQVGKVRLALLLWFAAVAHIAVQVTRADDESTIETLSFAVVGVGYGKCTCTHVLGAQ